MKGFDTLLNFNTLVDIFPELSFGEHICHNTLSLLSWLEYFGDLRLVCQICCFLVPKFWSSGVSLKPVIMPPPHHRSFYSQVFCTDRFFQMSFILAHWTCFWSHVLNYNQKWMLRTSWSAWLIALPTMLIAVTLKAYPHRYHCLTSSHKKCL